MTPMPPDQQRRDGPRSSESSGGPEGWPTQPGAPSSHLQIPPAPTMNDIQEAFTEGSVTVAGGGVQLGTNNQHPEAPAQCLSADYQHDTATAVAVEECTATGTNSPIPHPNQQPVSAGPLAHNSTDNGVVLPSPHVPFMGYMDEKGIIHNSKSDSSSMADEDQDGESEEKKTTSMATRKNPGKFPEEEKAELPISVEDILQASLNFEKSNPEKRFSSSLDFYYSPTSSRNLYPSLDEVDVGEPPLALQEGSTRQESIDSVRTTCADVVASASTVSGSIVKRLVVPEPPGTETYAIATYAAQAVDDEEDVKIGVARAELDRADTDSPTYAVAAVDNMEYASAEATVLETSETQEEALLAKLAAEDAELLALKMSAYGGGYEGTPKFQSPAAAFPDQQATVVSITEHDVHPSEISHGAVRAELIGEDYNDVPAAIGTPSAFAASNSTAASTPANSATATHVASLTTPPHAVFSVEAPGYALVDSQATVIDGKSHWHAAHAEEATVLKDDSSVPYSDRKLPAVDTDTPSTPQRHNRFGEGEADHVTGTGGSCYNTAAYGTVASVACATADCGAVASVAYAEDAGTYGSATSVAYAEDQAEVVEIREDFHPAEVLGNEAQAELVSENVGAAIAFANGDDQAEVLGISEEHHPAEVCGNEARAELVAEDYGAAVAVPGLGTDDQAQVVEITDDYHPAEDLTGAAQADYVGEDYGAALTHGVEATALPAGDSEGLQAATVVGYDDESGVVCSPGHSRSSSCGIPVPDRTPPSARALTAPAAVGHRIDPVGTPLTQASAELDTVAEEDWMRTPSWAGESGAQGVVVLQPPMDGLEEQPAVAVAALEAYADAPPPAIDDTSCCSPGGYSRHAVAVSSISAYANTPETPFDDTDCSMVNRQAVQPEIPSPEVLSTEQSAIIEPAMPPPRSFNSTGNSDAGSVCSAASMSTSTTRAGFQKISSSFARGMEMLFGDTKPANGRKGQASDNALLAKTVLSRQLLPWSVIYSEPTNMWVATVNTNQKALDSKNVVEASKSLRAFSVVTEKQATCLAKAWSPPRMHAFSNNPACHICKAKFAVFRRACHCRNCGVAICVSSSGCSRPWPAKMCPETYNIKKESFLNVCAACDFLCTEFRLALLEGDRDKAIALHATGNINLVTPFANVKGELFYPVHCAALGGNLELLKWLVDENCCPIKSVRVSGRSRDSSNSFTEISTSKGRSLLGIALENRNVGIVRYLIVEKGIQLSGEKDITMDTLCGNLELVLRLLPEDAATGNSSENPIPHNLLSVEPPEPPRDTNANVRGLDTASDGSVSDACIICFDQTIDCVATPCGHQVCCLDCGRNITRCPVCAVECSFMRVFRP